MNEIKIYCNYGVLAAEKMNIYTYGSQHCQAICSDEMTVIIPDNWEMYKNNAGQDMVKAPWGFCYEINEVLSTAKGRPAFRALDNYGDEKTTYLYTKDEIEEKKHK